MKYVVLLGDGMADEKIAALDNKTPLQYANTPNMDYLATHGVIGMALTVPEGFQPGSDVANLSVLGYNPKEYYTGRSPLEAVSMGIELKDEDVAFRCNLVTLSEEEKYEEKKMVDYSADEIPSAESGQLMAEVNKRLGSEQLKFYPGFGFRHLLVWTGGHPDVKLTPPHDISGRVIKPYLPQGWGSEILFNLMKASNSFLPGHPVNKKRSEAGLRPANSIWFWGQGKRPALPKFKDKFGLSGSVISAVDLIKGIGICAGLDVVKLEGVTGTVKTNYKGKVRAALAELHKGKDFVYIHVEAPDAAGHRGEPETKIRAIEMVDEMLGMLMEGLKGFQNYKILLLPDHPTPLRTMTHSSNPVPFAIYAGDSPKAKSRTFDEDSAAASGLYLTGHTLMDFFVNYKN